MNKKKITKSIKKGSKKPAAKLSVRSGGAGSMNKSGVRPLGDRVLLKPLTLEEMGTKTSFGIIIPETVDKEKPEQGTIIAIGPGKRDENGRLQPIGVSVGDRVMFSKYGYDELKIEGVEYYIVSESNILAILK